MNDLDNERIEKAREEGRQEERKLIEKANKSCNDQIEAVKEHFEKDCEARVRKETAQKIFAEMDIMEGESDGELALEYLKIKSRFLKDGVTPTVMRDEDSTNPPEQNSCENCKNDAIEWEDCYECTDGFTDHDCGEDTCACLNPTPNVTCDICNGKGGWQRCSDCGYIPNEKEEKP